MAHLGTWSFFACAKYKTEEGFYFREGANGKNVYLLN
jgi:hypothetical protein